MSVFERPSAGRVRTGRWNLPLKDPKPRRPAASIAALLATALAAAIAGCSAPPAPDVSAPAPVPTRPAERPPVPQPQPEPPRTEIAWRRAVAQRIHDASGSRVFEGRPPHLLKAVVVLELTVGADGSLQRASVMRTPDHARALGDVAIRTVQAATPLPPPPRAMLSRGSVRFLETWLFRQDDRFQVRTLAEPQKLD
jgi:protein TonB